MKVHHLLTSFVPGCCITLLSRVKAAEVQRPKSALVQTETTLLIPLPDLLCRCCRLCRWRCRRRLGRGLRRGDLQRDWPPWFTELTFKCTIYLEYALIIDMCCNGSMVVEDALL
jgi:hypothetical protein